ncbi:hypothetical protein HPB49_007273 [Dermacentor silvarum]|uniref:Uncharacterized protein n=1 Tax=Dermacentor silvarum TaxID=543639 RepID=A0ACB8CDM4_DERSI|nr:hypothetical protein HPB49_007273 [Dermacentor silvarum]
MDFEIYQGKSTPLAETSLGLGPNTVLRLVRTLPEKFSIFFDRHFTTIPLLDEVLKKGIDGTGTIMANRVRSVRFRSDSEMKQGDIDELTRNDEKVAIVKWKDSRTVLLASTCAGATNVEPVKRWPAIPRAILGGGEKRHRQGQGATSTSHHFLVTMVNKLLILSKLLRANYRFPGSYLQMPRKKFLTLEEAVEMFLTDDSAQVADIVLLAPPSADDVVTDEEEGDSDIAVVGALPSDVAEVQTDLTCQDLQALQEDYQKVTSELATLKRYPSVNGPRSRKTIADISVETPSGAVSPGGSVVAQSATLLQRFRSSAVPVASAYQPWTEAQMKILAQAEAGLPPGERLVNAALAAVYTTRSLDAIKSLRRQTRYREILAEESARQQIPASEWPSRHEGEVESNSENADYSASNLPSAEDAYDVLSSWGLDDRGLAINLTSSPLTMSDLRALYEFFGIKTRRGKRPGARRGDKCKLQRRPDERSRSFKRRLYAEHQRLYGLGPKVLLEELISSAGFREPVSLEDIHETFDLIFASESPAVPANAVTKT